jgi:hypothetical protein
MSYWIMDMCSDYINESSLVLLDSLEFRELRLHKLNRNFSWFGVLLRLLRFLEIRSIRTFLGVSLVFW